MLVTDPVLLDVDGALVRWPTCEIRFLRELRRYDLFGRAQFRDTLLFLPRWVGAYGGQVVNKNKAYLAGLQVAEVASLAEWFVERRLRRHLHPETMRRVERHHARGDPVALLTGTLDIIARPLAAMLGAQTWRATICNTADGRYTAQPPLVHPFGFAKVVQGRSICAEWKRPLSDCVAYADSIHDRPLLAAVGKPIATFPDRRLCAVARRQGWEVLSGGTNRCR